MPWFKVDDQLGTHMKAVSAGNAAMGLWVRAGSWSASQLTDGYVPTAVVSQVLGGNRAQAKALVDAGLWLEEAGGYRFHQWEDHQPMRTEVLARREEERVRKAEARAAKKAKADQQRRLRAVDDQ